MYAPERTAILPISELFVSTCGSTYYISFVFEPIYETGAAGRCACAIVVNFGSTDSPQLRDPGFLWNLTMTQGSMVVIDQTWFRNIGTIRRFFYFDDYEFYEVVIFIIENRVR